MNNLSITNRKWKEFFLEDVVSINGGKRLTKADMELGDMPFIGASEMNNGITAFTCSTNESLDSNVLGVNYNGSVGFSFYHPYKAIFSDDVKRIKWLDSSRNNRYTLLFLSSMIGQQKCKFAYGYKFNAQRMKRQKILLPVCADGTIDWLFMEEYMRLKERQVLKPTIDKLCKRLIANELMGGGKSLHSNWKAFYFTEVFTEIQRGKRLKKADHKVGDTPYVSSTSFNNGVDGFIGNDGGVRRFEDCLTLANSGSVGSAFYHRYEFIASDHVTQLKREGLDKYAYLFMIPLINRLSEKYSFNREINDERIKREKLLLPVTDAGDIDFQFMSSFMKKIETDILGTTLATFQNRLKDNRLSISKLGGVIWNEFYIRDLFPRMEVGKSKGLNHLEKDDFGISYLGATNLNNGVLCFVKAVDNLVQKGNCIAFIRNGEGSMGYSVYKAEDFIATSDMTLAYSEHINKYTGMFITTIADRIRGKYNFGYKRSATRLAKEVLSLPITPTGQPNWEFMEQYMRNIESIQILRYLSSINNRTI